MPVSVLLASSPDIAAPALRRRRKAQFRYVYRRFTSRCTGRCSFNRAAASPHEDCKDTKMRLKSIHVLKGVLVHPMLSGKMRGPCRGAK